MPDSDAAEPIDMLVVDDDHSFCQVLLRALTRRGLLEM
jgi:ActR/RegA family two-component response regulator